MEATSSNHPALSQSRAQVLLEINNAIASHLELAPLLKAISECLRRELPHDFAGLAIYDPEIGKLRIHGLNFEAGQERFSVGQVVSLEGTPGGLAFTSRRPVLRHRPDPNEFPDARMKEAMEAGVKSGCVVPLICHGNALGTLAIASLRESAFTEADAELLSQIGTQVAIAVENALNFEKLRAAEREIVKERDHSRLLLEINNAVVSQLDLKELLKCTSASLQRVVPHDVAHIALCDSSGTQLRVRALDIHKPIEGLDEGLLFSIEGTPEGEAIHTGRAVLIRNRSEIERYSPHTVRSTAAYGIASGCIAPLVAQGRKLGSLSILSFREGAFTEEDAKVLTHCSQQIALAVQNALAVAALEQLKDKLAREKLYLEDEIRSELNFDEIIGQSPALRKVLQMVETVANSDSTVLLLGETGTGKELIARAVHNHSRRKLRTFVKLNCAAIPTGLLESELFGHEKGAFTGAISQKIGRLELADQGTLFLDEVGDIPLDIQPKLLRALQEREFERLGSTHTKKVNVRLVAATNRNLEKMIADREFRSDLYYRLNVFPIRIPPLRERPDDIPLLVRYFAEKLSRQMQKSIESVPAAAMAKLKAWHWPGNIRELENLIERSVILTNGSVLQVPLSELEGQRINGDSLNVATTLESTEREHIIKILRETQGVLAGPNGAAFRLGLKRTTLQYKMKKLGISRHHWSLSPSE
ncbi:MAG TPA: sigma 54-interacting transcriptional regulator [Candidatus Eremiobacteraceae bacterium]|nr:sigma 54-interacting transcriptional regulator [Candidatus Eremiobacteraceae bacterium]